jgi:hypothetical protein
VTDALNRRDHEVHIAAINMYMKDLKYKIVASSNLNHSYLKIKETLQQGKFQQKLIFMRWMKIEFLSLKEKCMCRILVR